MNEVKFVLDTNVLVSAALFKGSLARQAFNKAGADGKILISDDVLAELQDVFSRPRFDKYLSAELRMIFLNDFLKVAEIIDITQTIAVCRDPKDNKFLELALSGHATHLLSSDKDLLVLHPFQGIAIVTPADFLAKAL